MNTEPKLVILLHGDTRVFRRSSSCSIDRSLAALNPCFSFYFLFQIRFFFLLFVFIVVFRQFGLIWWIFYSVFCFLHSIGSSSLSPFYSFALCSSLTIRKLFLPHPTVLLFFYLMFLQFCQLGDFCSQSRRQSRYPSRSIGRLISPKTFHY